MEIPDSLVAGIQHLGKTGYVAGLKKQAIMESRDITQVRGIMAAHIILSAKNPDHWHLEDTCRIAQENKDRYMRSRGTRNRQRKLKPKVSSNIKRTGRTLERKENADNKVIRAVAENIEMAKLLVRWATTKNMVRKGKYRDWIKSGLNRRGIKPGPVLRYTWEYCNAA